MWIFEGKDIDFLLEVIQIVDNRMSISADFMDSEKAFNSFFYMNDHDN